MYHLESRVRAGHRLPGRNCPLTACKARAMVSTWQNRSNITSSLLGSMSCRGCGPASHGSPCWRDVQQQGWACGQSSERDLAPLPAYRGCLRMAVGRVCPGTPRRCWTNASSPAAPGRPRGPSPFAFCPDAWKTPCDLGAPTWKEGDCFGLPDGRGCRGARPGGRWVPPRMLRGTHSAAHGAP